jgi:hypothetical protein
VASGAATAWNPNANGEVMALAVNGELPWRHLHQHGGQPRNAIAVPWTRPAARPPTEPDARYGVTRGIVDWRWTQGTVYVGGDFYSIGGQQQRYRRTRCRQRHRYRLEPKRDAVQGARDVAPAVNGGTVYAGATLVSVGAAQRYRRARCCEWRRHWLEPDARRRL